MTLRPLGILAALSFGLAACGGSDIATRNVPADAPVLVAKKADYNVTEVRVTVPETLNVSEANLFYPIADIVWREDPYGDRYEQVKAIFQTGLDRGALELKSGQAVIVEVEVLRFHSLTQKTRATVGGTHSIKFNMTLRDAETGAIVAPPRFIEADLDAYGGQRAIDAERRGLTQKVRITHHLANVLKRELSTPTSGPEADAAVAQHISNL